MHIKEIDIRTNDLEGSLQFYHTILGLECLAKNTHALSFRAGRSVLTFTAAGTGTYIYHFAFDIPNNKMTEAIEWLADKAERIPNPDGAYLTHFENWNAESVYFYDNNHNVVELITRYDQQVYAEAAFSAEQLLSISEIGLVTEQPIAFADELICQYPLEYYHKGPKRDDFVVLGDEQGLFIISGPSRHWYPTDLQVARQPLKVVFSKEQTVAVLLQQQ